VATVTFSRVKPLGWAFGEVLTSAQMNALDAILPDALDGADGGEYTPSAVLEIGGEGLRRENTVTVVTIDDPIGRWPIRLRGVAAAAAERAATPPTQEAEGAAPGGPSGHPARCLSSAVPSL
jgi:hypothetical protein